MRNRTLAITVVALAALTVSAVVASVTFTPPDSPKQVQLGNVTLMPAKAAPKAKGTATFLRNMEKTKYVMTLQISGLDAKKVYTVWFVSMGKSKDMKDMKMEGVGKMPYTLKVSKAGKAEVSYNLPSNPLDKWTTLEIVEHPDKNPKNMKNMVPVMMGDLTKLKAM